MPYIHFKKSYLIFLIFSFILPYKTDFLIQQVEDQQSHGNVKGPLIDSYCVLSFRMHHQSHLFLLLRDLPSPATPSTYSSHLSPAFHAPALPHEAESQRHVTDRRESHKVSVLIPGRSESRPGCLKGLCMHTILRPSSASDPARASGLWTLDPELRDCDRGQTQPKESQHFLPGPAQISVFLCDHHRFTKGTIFPGSTFLRSR